jgi:radical SAM superfamily enzyme YgiQ (UPF0313 family)
MRVLLVHPSPLMYSEIYLRLALGLSAWRRRARAGHDVRLLDLQIFSHKDYFREVETFAPQAIGFSLNYLANVPEVLDLARQTRQRRPECFIFSGGHSGSFIAAELLEHGAGALDCVVRGEGELITPKLLEALCEKASLKKLGRRHARRRRAAPGVHGHRRASAGPRSAAAAAQVLHRRPGPRRVHRDDARVPLGLLVLQRLDVLRAQLPPGLAGGRRRGRRADPRAQRVHRGRRRVRAPRERLCHRPGAGEAGCPEAVLPRDTL